MKKNKSRFIKYNKKNVRTERLWDLLVLDENNFVVVGNYGSIFHYKIEDGVVLILLGSINDLENFEKTFIS